MDTTIPSSALTKTGNEKTYVNSTEAYKDVGLSAPTHIFGCIYGRGKTCAGYKWKWANDESIHRRKLNYPIRMHKIGEDTFETYSSITEMNKKYNFPSLTHIRECCKGKRRSAYGYIFEYVND